MEGYPYKSTNGVDMEPVASQWHNVAIHYITHTFYRKVMFYEAIVPFQAINLGALAAGATSPRTQVPNLEVYNGEFAQWRWYPVDNAQCRLYLPQGNAKYDLRNIQPPIDPTIINTNPSLNLTEFYVWENNRPAVEAIAGVALLAVRIRAQGFRFHTAAIYAHTYQEKQLLASVRNEPLNAGKTEAELMAILASEKRIPCVDVWASGMGAQI